MGEKLPYYCRVKKILAAVKNGSKLARPVVKWAFEKTVSLFENSFLIMLMDWLLAPDLCVTRHRFPACHYPLSSEQWAKLNHCTVLNYFSLFIGALQCMYSTEVQCTVGPSVNKATSVSLKGDDNSLPSPPSKSSSFLSHIFYLTQEV